MLGAWRFRPLPSTSHTCPLQSQVQRVPIVPHPAVPVWIVPLWVLSSSSVGSSICHHPRNSLCLQWIPSAQSRVSPYPHILFLSWALCVSVCLYLAFIHTWAHPQIASQERWLGSTFYEALCVSKLSLFYPLTWWRVWLNIEFLA